MPKAVSSSRGARTPFSSGALPAQPNQSLIDGLRVLQTLVSHPGPVGSRDMALLLDMEPTRANRLLGTLAAIGLAQQGVDRKYRPGPGVHVLAAQSVQGSHLLACALPHLEQLRQSIAAPDAVVAVGVLWQRQVCFLVHARPRQAMTEAIGSHELEPAGNSSIGVLFLARAGDESEIALAQAELSSLPKPPLHPLARSVEMARENGFGRLDFSKGDVSLAVSVGEPAIAGLAVSAKFSEAQVPGVVERLRQSAARIAAQMNSPHPDGE